MLLENVKTFKYLRATLKADGSADNELRIIIATATSAMIRLNSNGIVKISALK